MSTAAAEKKAHAGDTVRLLTETKYMQQYRLRSALYGDNPNLLTICNSSGQMEFFITHLGRVWHYYPVSNGYQATQLNFNLGGEGIEARVLLAASTDGNNKLIVFAAYNKKLQYIRENTKAGEHRWEKAVEIDLFNAASAPAGKLLGISKLYTHNVGRSLFIGAAIEVQTAAGKNDYTLAYSELEHHHSSTHILDFKWAPNFLYSLECVWSGSTKDTVAFTTLNNEYRDYRLSSKEWVTHGPLSRDTKSVVRVGDQYFSIGASGELRILHSDSNDRPKYWKAIDPDNGGYDSMLATTGPNGAIDFFYSTPTSDLALAMSGTADRGLSGINWKPQTSRP